MSFKQNKKLAMNHSITSPKLVNKTRSRKDNFNTTYKNLFLEQTKNALSFKKVLERKKLHLPSRKDPSTFPLKRLQGH
jgi:hypothetical protein